jgi:hypothetical protein
MEDGEGELRLDRPRISSFVKSNVGESWFVVVIYDVRVSFPRMPPTFFSSDVR